MCVHARWCRDTAAVSLFCALLFASGCGRIGYGLARRGSPRDASSTRDGASHGDSAIDDRSADARAMDTSNRDGSLLDAGTPDASATDAGTSDASVADAAPIDAAGGSPTIRILSSSGPSACYAVVTSAGGRTAVALAGKSPLMFGSLPIIGTTPGRDLAAIVALDSSDAVEWTTRAEFTGARHPYDHPFDRLTFDAAGADVIAVDAYRIPYSVNYLDGIGPRSSGSPSVRLQRFTGSGIGSYTNYPSVSIALFTPDVQSIYPTPAGGVSIAVGAYGTGTLDFGLGAFPQATGIGIELANDESPVRQIRPTTSDAMAGFQVKIAIVRGTTFFLAGEYWNIDLGAGVRTTSQARGFYATYNTLRPALAGLTAEVTDLGSVTDMAFIGSDVLIAGYAYSGQTVLGTLISTPSGTAVFVARLRLDGTLLWLQTFGAFRYFGNLGRSYPQIAVAADERIVVIGDAEFDDIDFGSTFGSFTPASSDSFVVTYSGGGTMRGVTTIRGPGTEEVRDIAIIGNDLLLCGFASDGVTFPGDTAPRTFPARVGYLARLPLP